MWHCDGSAINGPIDSGALFFDGKPIPVEGRELARHRADVGMVFQSFNLFARKTILQNVTLGPVNVRGIAQAEAAAQAIGLLERAGIEFFAQPRSARAQDFLSKIITHRAAGAARQAEAGAKRTCI